MQKGFLRKAAFTLIMLLILVSASSALAATNSKTYTDAKITHVWKCGPVSRSSGSTKFTSGKDDNTRIVFAVSGLERYQVVELVNASNVSVSGQAEVPTGQSSGTLSVYSAYQTISSIYLQIRNCSGAQLMSKMAHNSCQSIFMHINRNSPEKFSGL